MASPAGTGHDAAAICPGCGRPVSECRADDVDESFPAEPPVAAPDHAEIERAAETLRDACLAVERSAGQSVIAERRMDAAERWLRDLLPAETVLALLAERQQDKAAYLSLRVELARIFGPVQPREGQTWNEAMLGQIAAVLAGEGDATPTKGDTDA